MGMSYLLERSVKIMNHSRFQMSVNKCLLHYHPYTANALSLIVCLLFFGEAYVLRQNGPSKGARQDLMLGEWAVSYLMCILIVKYAQVF